MLFENNDYLDLDMLYASNLNNSYNYAYSFNNNQESNEEKYLRGNMFDDLFKPYKNMTYLKPKLKTEREKDLFEIQKYSFMINDYNLYLDIYPDDKNVLNKYNEATDKLHMLKKEYQKKYGPLMVTKGGYDKYMWSSSPWPWDKESGMYV